MLRRRPPDPYPLHLGVSRPAGRFIRASRPAITAVPCIEAENRKQLCTLACAQNGSPALHPIDRPGNIRRRDQGAVGVERSAQTLRRGKHVLGLAVPPAIMVGEIGNCSERPREFPRHPAQAATRRLPAAARTPSASHPLHWIECAPRNIRASARMRGRNPDAPMNNPAPRSRNSERPPAIEYAAATPRAMSAPCRAGNPSGRQARALHRTTNPAPTPTYRGCESHR